MGSLSLFFRLVRASIAGQARYPASALMLTVGQFLGTGIEIVAVWALFHRFGDVQGWQAIGGLGLQVFWIAVLVAFGHFAMGRTMRGLQVQGG